MNDCSIHITQIRRYYLSFKFNSNDKRNMEDTQAYESTLDLLSTSKIHPGTSGPSGSDLSIEQAALHSEKIHHIFESGLQQLFFLVFLCFLSLLFFPFLSFCWVYCFS